MFLQSGAKDHIFIVIRLYSHYTISVDWKADNHEFYISNNHNDIDRDNKNSKR